jgi:hypothetical protein
MGAAVVVAVIIGIFFAVGLAVGGIGVMALPMLRDRQARRREQHEPPEDPDQPEHRDDPSWPV